MSTSPDDVRFEQGHRYIRLFDSHGKGRWVHKCEPGKCKLYPDSIQDDRPYTVQAKYDQHEGAGK